MQDRIPIFSGNYRIFYGEGFKNMTQRCKFAFYNHPNAAIRQ